MNTDSYRIKAKEGEICCAEIIFYLFPINMVGQLGDELSCMSGQLKFPKSGIETVSTKKLAAVPCGKLCSYFVKPFTSKRDVVNQSQRIFLLV